MKVLDPLSVFTYNRFKQSLPVASSSHFQADFWNHVLVWKSLQKSYKIYRISLDNSKTIQRDDVFFFKSSIISIFPLQCCL